MHPHPDVARAGTWNGDLLQAQHVSWRAVAVEAEGAHGLATAILIGHVGLVTSVTDT